MTFEEVLSLAKKDHRNNFTRPGLIRTDGKQKRISRHCIEECDLVNMPHFISDVNGNNYAVWTPGSEDLFANDWKQIK